MTKTNPEYRRLTGSIMAESDTSQTMPLPLAVGLIIQHSENMLGNEPTPRRCREFLIEVASILLMVEGFFDVVEKPSEDEVSRNRQMPRNIQRSMDDMAERLNSMRGDEAADAKRKAKMN